MSHARGPDQGSRSGPRQVHDGFTPVLALAREHLGCDRAGVAVRGADGAVLTLAASDDVVGVADRLQSAHAEGPAATPTWSAPQVALDLDVPGPWPAWTRGLAGLGVASVLATQIVTEEGTTGVLILYYARRTAFSEPERTLASVLAQYAASELRYLRLLDHLHTAVEGRTWIGQAQGLLMSRYELDSEEAFAVLQRHSQDTNTKLRDVAHALVETGHLDNYVVGRHG